MIECTDSGLQAGGLMSYELLRSTEASKTCSKFSECKTGICYLSEIGLGRKHWFDVKLWGGDPQGGVQGKQV